VPDARTCRDELVLFDGSRIRCSGRPRHRYFHQHIGESIDGRGKPVRYFLRWGSLPLSGRADSQAQ